MIDDAEAMATLAAPCLPGLVTAPEGETPEQAAVRLAKLAAVKATLRGAIIRWSDVGSGGTASQQKTAGPFGEMQTFTQSRKSLFWPSEIDALQGICSDGKSGKAYSVDTVGGKPGWLEGHAEWCDLRFGAVGCSCGASLAGWPLFYEIP